MGEEEVRRVSDALDAVEQLTDREQRVRAQSQIMAEQIRRNREWSAERTALIRELWDDGNGLSYQQIADRLGIKKSTVQDVFRGYKGSGTVRPRVQQSED
ncbi:helix-turn-helix domain-containing protein [Streptomyces phaeochromogenes]|uniref:helix-turn-helix domain-containing protein n=1 Tax=Streptomyces phaeochromogenes TaxID=1923 RepID=UPI002DDB5E08|nr:helix-turn-helix domain-containing protein [Streptomyces phaeochromogenes]WRZ30204.1 helix-turn-helix domain-containing protein [Streptomyces phaeochromogenes]